MLGIYIHIPYCRQACHYCNFHFSTSTGTLPEYIRALGREMKYRSELGASGPVSSVYLGGGTPSVLSADDLQQIFEYLTEYYDLSTLRETTIEVNPEDVNPEYLASWRGTPIDRVSLGVQSLSDTDLQWMNRSHDSGMALESIAMLREAGYENISTDLIFGYDALDDERWRYTLDRIIALQIPHISHYGLTIEPKTYFAHLDAQNIPLIDESSMACQMLLLYDTLETAGYHNYELSNSGLPGYEALHNSRYWKSEPYLGLGASAHGYDGQRQRYQNIANTPLYIKALDQGLDFSEVEILSEEEHYHEYLMTRLRTDRGIEWLEFEKFLDPERKQILLTKINNLNSEWYHVDERGLRLSYEGWIWSDAIFRDLFD